MRYPMLEHKKMDEMRRKHPNWIWNRSDVHTVLGVPGTLDAFKTPVEPGNSFSPGPGTFGVSTWLYSDKRLHAPEELPIEALLWEYEDGHLPILVSTWQAGPFRVQSSLFTHGDVKASRIHDYLQVRVSNTAAAAATGELYLVLRSFGAAGGGICGLSLAEGNVLVDNKPLVLLETPPETFGAVSYERTGKDISVYLREGSLPNETEVWDPSTWASCAVGYSLSLAPGEAAEYSFVFPIHAKHWMLNWHETPCRPYRVDGIRQEVTKKWKGFRKIGLDLPDRQFTDAFYCQLFHLYMFTVANEPRISPVSYPLWWLRDGAYVVNALGKGGFHDFCEQACRETAPRKAFGGFGSEGDAPGEVIWILSDHYLLTRDKKFLADVYPHIAEKADMLIEMRHTEDPIKVYTENAIPQLMLEPDLDIMCMPAQDGFIIGRMDRHLPLVWVNSFAYFGLRRAALCARELGLDNSVYEREAADLKDKLSKRSRELFGQNDRDVNCAFWPTGWANRDDAFIMGKFNEFWDKVRFVDGEHRPEPMWTYFEAGQAHNNIINGHRERAWVSIDYFLGKHTAQGLYTYHESDCDENSSLLWQRTRGWDDINFVTPHGWTAAELFLLLRDCLAREEDGALLIGSGVPMSWKGRDFSVCGLPTYHGRLSYRYEAESDTLRVQGGLRQDCRVVSDLPWEVKIIIESDERTKP